MLSLEERSQGRGGICDSPMGKAWPKRSPKQGAGRIHNVEAERDGRAVIKGICAIITPLSIT
jgi:hypothetical protein